MVVDAPPDTGLLRATQSKPLVRACPYGVHGDPTSSIRTVAQPLPGIIRSGDRSGRHQAARARIELEPDYTFVAARLLLADMDIKRWEWRN